MPCVVGLLSSSATCAAKTPEDGQIEREREAGGQKVERVPLHVHEEGECRGGGAVIAVAEKWAVGREEIYVEKCRF